MITHREKALLHIYAQASGVSRPTYVNILREHAGVSSSADPAMTQGGFRRAMASLERHLWAARDAGRAAPLPRTISRRGYWQARIPAERTQAGPTKLHLISRLQDDLTLSLSGTGAQRDTYIQAAMERAICAPIVSLAALTDRQADAVIQCLRRIHSRHSTQLQAVSTAAAMRAARRPGARFGEIIVQSPSGKSNRPKPPQNRVVKGD